MRNKVITILVVLNGLFVLTFLYVAPWFKLVDAGLSIDFFPTISLTISYIFISSIILTLGLLKAGSFIRNYVTYQVIHIIVVGALIIYPMISFGVSSQQDINLQLHDRIKQANIKDLKAVEEKQKLLDQYYQSVVRGDQEYNACIASAYIDPYTVVIPPDLEEIKRNPQRCSHLYLYLEKQYGTLEDFYEKNKASIAEQQELYSYLVNNNEKCKNFFICQNFWWVLSLSQLIYPLLSLLLVFIFRKGFIPVLPEKSAQQITPGSSAPRVYSSLTVFLIYYSKIYHGVIIVAMPVVAYFLFVGLLIGTAFGGGELTMAPFIFLGIMFILILALFAVLFKLQKNVTTRLIVLFILLIITSGIFNFGPSVYFKFYNTYITESEEELSYDYKSAGDESRKDLEFLENFKAAFDQGLVIRNECELNHFYEAQNYNVLASDCGEFQSFYQQQKKSAEDVVANTTNPDTAVARQDDIKFLNQYKSMVDKGQTIFNQCEAEYFISYKGEFKEFSDCPHLTKTMLSSQEFDDFYNREKRDLESRISFNSSMLGFQIQDEQGERQGSRGDIMVLLIQIILYFPNILLLCLLFKELRKNKLLSHQK